MNSGIPARHWYPHSDLLKLNPRSLLTEVLGHRLGRFWRSLHREHFKVGGLRAMTRSVLDGYWSVVVWSVQSQIFPGKGCSIKVHHVTKDDSGYWRWWSNNSLMFLHHSVNPDFIIPSCTLKLEEGGTVLTKKKPIDILSNVCYTPLPVVTGYFRSSGES